MTELEKLVAGAIIVVFAIFTGVVIESVIEGSQTSKLQYKVEYSGPYKPTIKYFDTYREAQLEYNQQIDKKAYVRIIDQWKKEQIAYNNNFVKQFRK